LTGKENRGSARFHADHNPASRNWEAMKSQRGGALWVLFTAWRGRV
jgi:hypothetical protein